MNEIIVPRGAEIPRESRPAYDHFDRHIIHNSLTKEIYVQVLHDVEGNPKMEEYKRMKAGLYLEYIPPFMQTNIKEMVAIGYKVRPVWVNGFNSNQGNILYQICDLVEGRGGVLLPGANYNPRSDG